MIDNEPQQVYDGECACAVPEPVEGEPRPIVCGACEAGGLDA